MRHWVVILSVAAVLLGLTIWITTLGKVGIFTVFSFGDIAHDAKDHINMVAISMAIAIAVSVPTGVLITRPVLRRVAPFAIGGAGIGQSVPSLAVIAIMAPLLGFGLRSAIVALVVYSLLPILRNSYVGVRNISPAVIEAAEGMGMSRWQIARKIELPLARPVIMAGIRISTVIAVGTAELAVLVGGKGLGVITFTGVVAREPLIILQGAAPTALMAVVLGFVLELAERRMTPRGVGAQARGYG
jgi:osmoprotectant transport system permease protein